jgi:threonine/homoserine/homoserine lactone efflux protein
MQPGTMLLFAGTVMPLICTPGPDILFVASQGMSGGRAPPCAQTWGCCLDI